MIETQECGKFVPIYRDGKILGGNTVIDPYCAEQFGISSDKDEKKEPLGNSYQNTEDNLAEQEELSISRIEILKKCGKWKPIYRGKRVVGGNTVIDPKCAREIEKN